MGSIARLPGTPPRHTSTRTLLRPETCLAHGPEHDSIPASLWSPHQYEWPGNIRELRSVLERSVILTKGRTLQDDGH